jgi:hypothetical protein
MSAEVHPFDLQERARLAIHGLTALLDPQRDGLMYFLANWRTRPPRADHGLWDCGDGSGRHVDALALARAMMPDGSAEAQPVGADKQLEDWMVRLLGDDGLSWLPVEPWAAPWGADLLLAGEPNSPRYAEISWAQRGTLMGLISRYLRTSDERYLELAHRQVDGMLRVAVRHPDGLFFPEGYYRSDGWHTERTGIAAGIEENNAVVIVPAVRLYEVSGYEPALELADGLARFALRHTTGYEADGSMQTPQGGSLQVHVHTRTSFAMGMLKLGLALGRREYVAWARQSYASARAWGTEFGWFPEGLGLRHGEICCTTDMVEIALLLGQNVNRSYYADAECYGRNHLLESQFISLDRLLEALERLPADEQDPPWDGRYSTCDDVAGRQVGAFASRPAVNDGFHPDATWLMQCCSAAGTRALYDLWRYAIEEHGPTNGRRLSQAVHLRFSVETPHLTVVSHEPAEGRLDLTAKCASGLEVRLPRGGAQALLVQGSQVRSLQASDGYVLFALGDGERAELHYPLGEWSRCYEVGRDDRRAVCIGYWRGETLMRMDPAGAYYPLYVGRSELGPVVPRLPGGDLIPAL